MSEILTPKKLILYALALAGATAIFFVFFFEIPPAEAKTKRFTIEIRFADPKNPCAVVAGVRRTKKIKTTADSIRYATNRPPGMIVYYFKKKKPTCALIRPKRTLF